MGSAIIECAASIDTTIGMEGWGCGAGADITVIHTTPNPVERGRPANDNWSEVNATAMPKESQA